MIHVSLSDFGQIVPINNSMVVEELFLLVLSLEQLILSRVEKNLLAMSNLGASSN